MHIYFSGIGGAGIGPLSMIAHQAGYSVSGSDKQASNYTKYLQKHGISNIHIGQDRVLIQEAHDKNPIDWFVYSSAVAIENPDGPEFQFCRENNIKMTKRDELLNRILEEKNLKLIAVAGTHGKTTTTAMAVWLCKQIGLAASHLLPAKTTFCEMGQYTPDSEHFIYECDEFDRNFLSYRPHLSLISGIDYDHPDIYPTRESYEQAFRDFISQSTQTILWRSDLDRLGLQQKDALTILEDDEKMLSTLSLVGEVNRRDAWEVIQAIHLGTGTPIESLVVHMNLFPGVSRRFEEIAPNIYSDYAHTPEKIRGALQLAQEVAGDSVVVVYEGLHNTRQHFIKDDLTHLFDSAKKLYVIPSYLAREDTTLDILDPDNIIGLTSKPENGIASNKDKTLKQALIDHQAAGDLILCLTAGGGNSLDEWLRQEFDTK